jgi:hypothetical protein
VAADTVCAKPLRLVNDFFHMPALCVFFSLNFPPVRESTCCSIFRWCLCNGHLLIHRRTVADAEVLGIKEPLADQHSFLAGDPGGVEGDTFHGDNGLGFADGSAPGTVPLQVWAKDYGGHVDCAAVASPAGIAWATAAGWSYCFLLSTSFGGPTAATWDWGAAGREAIARQSAQFSPVCRRRHRRRRRPYTSRTCTCSRGRGLGMMVDIQADFKAAGNVSGSGI